MILSELPIAGAFTIRPEPSRDARGAFARLFDEAELAARGLKTRFPQWSQSRNTRAGTLRGMHYSVAPAAETKLVRVTRGAVFDVLLDLRPGSATQLHWISVELDADDGLAVYIPPGVAHGFQTLTDNTDILYHITPSYQPVAARGVRWDDPAFGIAWPSSAGPRILSERDLAYPDFRP